jgi:hypothetical protein
MAYCRSTLALLNTIPHGLHLFRSSDRSFRPTLFRLRCRSLGTEVVDPKKYRVSWRNLLVTRDIKMQTKIRRFINNVSATNARYWGPITPWKLKLQNLTLPILPLPWQLDVPSSYTSHSKKSGFTGGPCIQLPFQRQSVLETLQLGVPWQKLALWPNWHDG